MIKIPLTKNQFALIDEIDYPLISQCGINRWFCLDHGKRQYAQATYSVKNKTKHIYMHRLIMGNPKGKEIDHINFNGLDNRRENLRICSKSQNHFNIRKSKSASKYKGVIAVPSTGKWAARIKVDGKKIHLGTFVNEADAGRAYDRAAIQYGGEFAFLNFPENKKAM